MDEAILGELRRQLGIEGDSVNEGKLEDMPLSKLRRHLEVLGANLELIVHLPGDVKITLRGLDELSNGI
ncbi:MAG: hypothetical protein P0Y58_25415 [Candidatus Pseudomonas phytovorans]|uniref:Uncharacterized protein n=1 Tax=Candidatus Pseudomonas phytovorans TaxID=3121377 RepID=A0AAJ5WG55_9PSED|nr:hypothetical protein [Pseudomonas sp.]WEK30190.1 MAG: hypothetical protein P0Y58_25415 [Pseudomonas sp.]